MWPNYSKACRKDVDDLLKAGGSLSAYRANPLFPSWTGPAKGSWADRLERDIERRFRVKHCVVVNSGTAALHAALASLRLKAGDEVVTTPFSFSATSAAIVLAGGVPVFADVDPYTFNITKETVSGLVSKRTRAILPVSLFGLMADVRSLRTLGLPVIEDACQAVGARSGESYSGTTGLAGAYSFNGTKACPAGEGGALVTNDDAVAERARLLGNHSENFFTKDVSFNFRLNELSACVAFHGMQDVEARNQRRRDLANRLYDAFLDGIGAKDYHGPFRLLKSGRHGIILFPDRCGPDHALYVYPMQVEKNRDRFIKRMKSRGIPVGAGYITPPLHKYPAFRKYVKGSLPVVEGLSRTTLCILSTLTPDRPLSYARDVAKAMLESLK